MRRTLAFALLSCSLGVWAGEQGAVLASQCYQCHGPNGVSKGEIDSIKGRSYSDLSGDMMEFKQSCTNGIMQRQAKIYTDAELRLIADYISTH